MFAASVKRNPIKSEQLSGLARVLRGNAQAATENAYRIAQELTQRAWDEGTPLRELLARDERTAGLNLDVIFDYGLDYGHYTRYAREIVGRLDELA